MIQSTIKFSQLEDRIDARFYDPLFLENEKSLDKSRWPVKSLAEISNRVVDGPFGSDLLVSEYRKEGVPLFRVSDIKEEHINQANLVFISKAKQQQLLRSKVVSGDVILTKAGTIGVAQVVPPEIPEANITSHLAKIDLKEGFNAHFVATFLNCKLGRLQIFRQGIKTTRPELNVEEVSITRVSIPPLAFQKHIENLVKKAHGKRGEAEEKYKEAEEVLEKELGLQKLDLSLRRSYQVNFSEVSDRFDSDFYQPRFIKIRELLLEGKHKTVTIGEIIQEIKYGTSEKVYYTEEGVPFLRVTDVDTFYTIWPEEGKFILPHEAERLKEYKVDKGDLIISRTGTLGSAVHIDEQLDGSIFGSYFIKVVLDYENLDPFFFAFFLNSKVGKLQSERLGSGGIQTNLTIDAIKSLIIPVLPKSTQQKISKLVKQSFELRQESKALIEEAKEKVENFIESPTQ